MMDDEKSDLERLILKDALLSKNSDNGLIGVRVWRGNELTLSNKETWENWNSIGHVALKTYGQDSQYISFYPRRCDKELANDKKHSEHDHLHNEQQDEIYGAPKEFLLKVNNLNAINAKIRVITEAIEQGKYTWSITNNCSHLTHQLLAIGGIQFTLSMKNQIMLRFFIYYFIKKYWLLITATTFLMRLVKNSHFLLDWQFKYENYLFYNNFSEKNLILSITKLLNRYLDKIFEQAKKSGRTWGYVCGIVSAGALLTPIISLFIFIKNALLITPEDIYLRAKELDLLKNYKQMIKNNSIYTLPSLVFEGVSITDKIAWVSVINTAQSSETSKNDTLKHGVSKIINFLGGHAVLVVEALIGNMIEIFREKLQQIQDEISDIKIARKPLADEFKKIEELELSGIQDNFIVYFYKKHKLYGLESSYGNIVALRPKILVQLEELDKTTAQKEFEEKYLATKLENFTGFSEHARYFAIFDIHAQSEHKLLSLSECKSDIGRNYKGYIDKIKIRQYIIDVLKGVFEISPDGIIQRDLGAWLQWLNNKVIEPARKDNTRLYPLGLRALNRLITHIQLESKQVAQLMKEEKYTDLPKWQFLGKYSLFPVKDWDGLNCSEWCNKHLYQVGAISRGKATAKSKPPKGIREIFVNSFLPTFG